MVEQSLMACHECDLILRIPALPKNGTARCTRCGAVLHQHRPNSLERTLAFALAGLILFILANTFPFLSFKLETQIRETTLITGIQELYADGHHMLSVLIFFTTIAAPFLQLTGILYVLLPLLFNRESPGMMIIFRWIKTLQPWSMMEVFMLGILVSLVKLTQMAKIIPGTAIFAFMLLIFVLAAASSSLDPHLVWERWKRNLS